MNIGPQARTVVCSDEAEEILKKEIESNKGLDLLYQRLEWILSRAPFIGMKLEYPNREFWLYELVPNRDDLPSMQAVYTVQENKVIIEFLNLVHPE